MQSAIASRRDWLQSACPRFSEVLSYPRFSQNRIQGGPMPLVAMTREMGSLGKDVAAQLSDRVGKQLVHHEIIGLLADKMRLRKSHVVRFLEGKAGIWERMTTDKTSLSIYTGDETLKLIQSGNVA